MGADDRLVTSSLSLAVGATAAISASAALAALAAALFSSKQKDLLPFSLDCLPLPDGVYFGSNIYKLKNNSNNNNINNKHSKKHKLCTTAGKQLAGNLLLKSEHPEAPLIDLLRFGAAAVEVSAALSLVEVWRLRALCRRSSELLRAKLVHEVVTSPPRQETASYAMSAVLSRSRARGGATESAAAEIETVSLVFREALLWRDYLDQVDCAGRAPLMQASQQGSVRLCQALLAAKANVNQKGGNRWTALHYAVTSRSAATCNLLLDWGADLNANSVDGRTPLYYAFQAGDAKDITELLSRRGARPDPRSKNSSGEADAAYLRYLTKEFFAGDGTEEEFDRTLRLANVKGGRGKAPPPPLRG